MKSNLFKILIAFLLLVCTANLVKAQDTIYKKDKSKLIAKVYEVNEEDIKFKDWNNQDGPTFMMNKTEIDRIIFANGRIMMMTADPYSLSGDVDIRDKTKAVKYEFFSPLTNDIAVGYEFMVKVGMNVEAKVGIIGIGIGEHKEARGAFVKIGPKFLLGSDHIQKGMYYSNGMRGRYFKPEIAVSIYTRTEEVSGGYYSGTYPNYTYVPASSQDVKYGSYSLSLVYGRQVILGKTMTLDWYFGLGFAFHTATLKSNPNTIYNDDYATQGTYDYGSVYFGKSFPMVMSSGITIGYLFK